MNFKKLTALAFCGMLGLSGTVPTISQEMMLHGDEAIAKRGELMKATGGAMRSLGTLSGDDAVAAAQGMLDRFSALSTLYPEDSATGDTKALPAIWSDGAGFETAMSNAVAASAALLVAAQSGDAGAYGAAIKGLGATCGACHSTYRQAR